MKDFAKWLQLWSAIWRGLYNMKSCKNWKFKWKRNKNLKFWFQASTHPSLLSWSHLLRSALHMLSCTVLMRFFSSCFLCCSTFHRNLHGLFFIMNSSIPDQKMLFALRPIWPTSSSLCKPQPTKHRRVMLLTYFLHLTSRLTNYRWLRSPTDCTHRSRRANTYLYTH